MRWRAFARGCAGKTLGLFWRRAGANGRLIELGLESLLGSESEIRNRGGGERMEWMLWDEFGVQMSSNGERIGAGWRTRSCDG